MTLADHLVADLAVGRIRSVAFVVPIGVSTTLPLYEVALATARGGWQRGLEDVRYWIITPEPEPPESFTCASCGSARERLESEGIIFIGSTYPEVEHGVVLLDPQGETIEADQVIVAGSDV
jgi:hypothetical protein